MPVSVPFVFVPGTLADATQVNADFQALVAFINGLSIPTTPVSIVNGGTGATNAAQALNNLGVAPYTVTPCTVSSSSTTNITLAQVAGSPTLTAYSPACTLVFVAPAITAPFTVQLGTLPALTLYDTPGVAPTATLAAGQPCMISYDSTLNGWILINTPNTAGAPPVPTGSIMDFAATTAPTGWLVCDGSNVSRTTYTTLFAVIGITWGAGDGSTTFGLPDFRGYFRRTWDNGAGIDPARIFATSQSDTFSSHTHTVAGTLFGGQGAASGGQNTDSSGSYSTGSSGGSETRPKNWSVLTIIKT